MTEEHYMICIDSQTIPKMEALFGGICGVDPFWVHIFLIGLLFHLGCGVIMIVIGAYIESSKYATHSVRYGDECLIFRIIANQGWWMEGVFVMMLLLGWANFIYYPLWWHDTRKGNRKFYCTSEAIEKMCSIMDIKHVEGLMFWLWFVLIAGYIYLAIN